MMSQPGKLTVAIHILPNISRSKGNQAIKLGQLLKYTMIFFFKNYTQKKRQGKLVPDLFLLFKKAYFKVNEVLCSLVSIYFDSLQLGIQ